MINIINYDKKEQKLIFSTDMQTSLANAIRRSALEIPIMAIDEVEIIQNDSALYDEIIAHRLGLVPIETSKTSKEIKFKLKATGPKTVYSTDIVPSVGTEYKLPLTILDNEQELEIIANARLGKGIEHIKFSPGLIFFRHNLDPEVLEFVNIDDEGNVTFNEEELERRKLSEELIKRIKKTTKANELLFNIESWGQIEVKEIFLKSIEALDENLKELEKFIK